MPSSDAPRTGGNRWWPWLLFLCVAGGAVWLFPRVTKSADVAPSTKKGAPGAGRESGARFLDALNLFTRLVNIGDVRSLATHPASTTHRQLSPEELSKAGVAEDMVRLSIGLEDVKDLTADLDRALAAV